MFKGENKMKMNYLVMFTMMILILSISVEAQTSPIIRLSLSNYDPMPVQPGQFVDVWVTVQNVGAGDAKDLTIRYIESPYFELVNPDEIERTIPVLGSYKDYVLKYRFKVANDVVEGVNNLAFEYFIENMPGITYTSNLKIEIKSSESPISISSVRLNPNPVEPGQKADLIIAVANPSKSSSLRDFSVTLQLANIYEGMMLELPFAPIDSTNKKSVNRIQPEQTTEFKFSLVIYPDAESKIYKIPVTFSYYDDVGTRYDESSFISLNVNSDPDLYAIIEGITVNKNVKSGEVIFDIVNKGVSNVKLLTVTLDESDSYEIISSSNMEYLGNVESDDFKSARFRVNIVEDAETITFPLILNFRDALNNEYTETIELTHRLRDAESNGNNSGIIIFLIIVIAIIGIIYYRRRQKRKKLLLNEEND